MEKKYSQIVTTFIHRNRKIFLSVILLVILGMGAFLRLYDIAGYMTFLGDEGRDVLVVKRMIVDHKFTLLGPTASVGGFFMGPIYYYFMLPFLWLWKLDPVGPAIMVALFGIVTIYIVYRIGKDFFNEWTGCIASSLYALSPLVIAYSRSSWNPNLVPFFSALLMYLLLCVGIHGKWKWSLWVGVVLGIGIQLHYLFLFLFPVAAIWIVVTGKRRSYVPIIVLTMVGFLVGCAPFLAFELRHGFPNTISIWQFLATGKDTGFSIVRFATNINEVIFRIFSRLVLRIPEQHMLKNYSVLHAALWIWSARLLIVSSVGLILVTAIRQTSLGRRVSFLDAKELVDDRGIAPKTLTLIVAWLAIVLFLFGLYGRAIYDYYFGIVFMLPFLVTGYLLSRLIHGQYTRYVAVGIWVALVVLNWQGRPFRYPPNNQLAQAKSIAREAYAKTGGKPFNFALVTSQNSDHAYRYFFEIWGNKPVTIENEAVDPQRQTITDQLIVVCEIPDCRPLGHPLWEIAGFGQAQIVGEWDVSFVKIFRLVHFKGEQS